MAILHCPISNFHQTSNSNIGVNNLAQLKADCDLWREPPFGTVVDYREFIIEEVCLNPAHWPTALQGE